eukprot:15476035-Alexandrium_andersonii.AAC.3
MRAPYMGRAPKGGDGGPHTTLEGRWACKLVPEPSARGDVMKVARTSRVAACFPRKPKNTTSVFGTGLDFISSTIADN